MVIMLVRAIAVGAIVRTSCTPRILAHAGSDHINKVRLIATSQSIASRVVAFGEEP